MPDNHIKQGNSLTLIHVVLWKRCVDMNDRQLRNVVDGSAHCRFGIRQDGFDILLSSWLYSALLPASKILKSAWAEGYCLHFTLAKPVTVSDIHAEGAMTALLKDAIQPNLSIILSTHLLFAHGGPLPTLLTVAIRLRQIKHRSSSCLITLLPRLVLAQILVPRSS